MKMASRSMDLISQKKKKNKLHVQHNFFLISNKTNLHVQHAFCFSLPMFCTTTTLFCRTKSSKFQVTHYFYEGIVVCAYQIFCPLCSCLLLFFTAPHFHLAGRSFQTASISSIGRTCQAVFLSRNLISVSRNTLTPMTSQAIVLIS